MKMKKPDLSALKPLLFQYGDKVVLGLSAIATVMLVGMGLLSAKNAGSIDWTDELKKAANSLEQKIANAPIPEADPTKEALLVPAKYRWDPVTSSFVQGAFIHLGEMPDIKRRNPQVLAVKDGEGQFQMDYLPALYYNYGLDLRNSTVEMFGPAAAAPAATGAPPGPRGPGGPVGMAGGDPFVKSADPLRMVVVQGVFPMAEEIEQFKGAFRVGSQADLFATKDLPRPIGLDVVRYEVLPDGKDGEKVNLYQYDVKREAIVVTKAIDDVLRRALFDEASLTGLDPYLHAGLVTPLPLLANHEYPKLRLPSFQINEQDPNVVAARQQGMPSMVPPTAGMPGGPAGAGKGLEAMPIKPMPWRQLGVDQKPLTDRFEGRYEPFHPLAQPIFREEALRVAGPGGPVGGPPPGFVGGPPPGFVPPGQLQGSRTFDPFNLGLMAVGAVGPVGPVGPQAFMPGDRDRGPGGPPPGTGFQPRLPNRASVPPTAVSPGAPMEKWKYDALVRFIDVGVEPGKSYRYELRVRMANPNYGKPDQVAFEDLAKHRELAPGKFVPTPAITIPGEYYFYAVDQVYVDKMGSVATKEQVKSDQVAMQLHRWFETARDLGAVPPRDYVIGDWGIAERILARRGEFVGHTQMISEVPVWAKDKGVFEIPQTLDPTATKKDKDKRKPGVPLDFVPPADPARRGILLPAPLVVDFEGGRKDNFKVTPQITVARDDSAIDVLIMKPDGKLTVRNTRREADAGTLEGRDRRDRVELWKDHLHNADTGGPARAGPGNPAVPGLPGINLPGMRKD